MDLIENSDTYHSLSGSIISLTGFGAAVGVPIALIGAAISGIGGATVGGSVAIKTMMKNNQLKIANDHFNSDHFGAMQLKIVLGRAAKDPMFAKKIKSSYQEPAHLNTLLNHISNHQSGSQKDLIPTQPDSINTTNS